MPNFGNSEIGQSRSLLFVFGTDMDCEVAPLWVLAARRVPLRRLWHLYSNKVFYTQAYYLILFLLYCSYAPYLNCILPTKLLQYSIFCTHMRIFTAYYLFISTTLQNSNCFIDSI